MFVCAAPVTVAAVPDTLPVTLPVNGPAKASAVTVPSKNPSLNCKEELPKLIMAMNEDGVMATITPDGIVWTVGDYKVSRKAIADVWGLTVAQMNRITNYIYSYDPFYKED